MSIDKRTGQDTARITPTSGAIRQINGWRADISRRLWLSDAIVLAVVVFGTQLLWFGLENSTIATREAILSGTPYWVISSGLIVLWMWALSLADSRDSAIIGSGNLEYMRVISSSFRLFGAIAIIAFVLRIDVARGYLIIALPAGTLFLAFSRWLWRQWLIRQRASGNYSARALLVGSRAAVAHVARELERHPSAGYTVVGACLPGEQSAQPVLGRIPVVGDIDGVARGMTQTQADTVVVTSADDLPAEKVKRISWGLEAGRQHLVIAPSIMDIAGPRIRSRPVAGLPLLHVETPRFTGGQRFVKRTLDIVLGGLMAVVLSPVMLIVAIAVRSTSRGPVFYTQTRVGYHGQPFRILKFRSMAVDADVNVPVAGRNAGNEVLFKMIDDPRVTPFGRFIRRHSIDELPQLLNVLAGSMSLVGPRPPLPSEVENYDDHIHRRFLVKPGMTGAWQVGGRSTLNWEDSVRLDLSYVENWSLAGDLVILVRTLRAVVRPGVEAA